MKTLLQIAIISSLVVAPASGFPEPVVEYEFDGDSVDVSGNGFDAVPTGPISYTQECGRAAMFNNPEGTGPATQYFSLPDLSEFGAGSFTIAMRMRSTDTSQNNGRLFGNHYNVPGVVFNYNRGVSENALIAVNSNNGAGLEEFFDQSVGPEGLVTDGLCHWMVLVVDRARNEARAYIDDFRQVKDATELGIVPLDQLRIGGSINAGQSAGRSFAARDTSVSRFLIFEVALTHDEVLRLVLACGGADLEPPFGVLDLADISAFAAGFLAMDPIADLNADGVFDLADINLFVSSFVGGCP